MSDLFRTRMQMQGGQMGKALKRQSDVIMDATFTRDIAYRKCYLQDKGTIFPEQNIYGYLKAKSVYEGKTKYDPSRLRGFQEIDAKYLVKSYYSIQSDTIDYYLQFRPNAHGTNPNIRVGSYVFIPDDLGVYNLWIIVARDDRPQFPQFYVLKCDFLAKWHISEEEIVHYDGVHVDTGTYFAWSVIRIQSSYNSGVWTDYVSTVVENQRKIWFPTNPDTQTLTYNKHITISNNPYRRTAWEISKVEDTNPFGVTKITLKQELEHGIHDDLCWVNTTTDSISDAEHGIDYDFYKPRTNDVVQHTPADETLADNSVISFTGVKPNLKCGGSYKTYTANFYQNEEFVEYRPYWHVSYYVDEKLICGFDYIYDGNNIVPANYGGGFVVSSDRKITYKKDNVDVFGIQYSYSADNPSNLKIRCLSNLSMIGNKIIITANNGQSGASALSASIEVEVEGL